MGFSRFALPATTIVRTGAERATLVRRTYSLVFANIVITVLGAGFAITNAGVMQAVGQHPWITMICWFAAFFLVQANARAYPRNVASLALFTFLTGVMIAPYMAFAERVQPGIATQAGLLTLSTFGVLTAFTWVSRRDFSAWGSFFVVGLWVLIATSILNIFFHNQTASLWIAGGTVLVFSGLLVFDTWRIKNLFGPDDYTVAAVTIYLDLLNMFLAILQLLGGGRRN